MHWSGVTTAVFAAALVAAAACRTWLAGSGLSFSPAGVVNLATIEDAAASAEAPAAPLDPPDGDAEGLASSAEPLDVLSALEDAEAESVAPVLAPVDGLAPSDELALDELEDGAADDAPPDTALLPPQPLSSSTAPTAQDKARTCRDMVPPVMMATHPGGGRCPDGIGAGLG